MKYFDHKNQLLSNDRNLIQFNKNKNINLFITVSNNIQKLKREKKTQQNKQFS
jgi:hypothetical protein